MDVADHARTGYIGRKADVEHNLGSYGVRLYDAELGRFTSVDPLWGLYEGLQPYQYAGNSPVMALDPGGDTIVFISDRAHGQYDVAKEHIVAAFPEAASYYTQVESAADHFVPRTNGNGDNSFEPLATSDGAYRSAPGKPVHGINWDPSHAASLGPTGSISPSLILFHEIVHAAGWVGGGLSDTDDGTTMTSSEERRVIAIENVVANILGQAVRDCHRCPEWKYFTVGKPTEGGRPSNTPTLPPQKHLQPITKEQQ